MGVDQNEAQRRRTADKPKLSTTHPIACIEKRVIDSEAFAALPPSAIVVLILLARNLEKGRNGHIFLSQEDAERHGVEKKTLYRQFKVLTASGFIYPTKRGGHGQCGKFALTWMPISKDTKGLYLGGFRACAYRDHDQGLKEWKKRRGKVSPRMGLKSPQPVELEDKKPLRAGDRNPHIELNTNRESEMDWITAALAQLASHGLAGFQCFEVEPRRTLQ